MTLPGTITRRDALLLLALLAVAVAVAVSVIGPRGASLDERARAIESQLRCPTCQGLSIADSPATAAAQMRALVREQLGSGITDDAVRAFFVARYGRWILLDPPLSGADLALWLAPVLIVGSGAILVARRSRRRDEGATGAGGATWRALPSGRPSRLATLLLGAGMVLALAVPIGAAVAPRLAGGQISGLMPQQPGASIAELEAYAAARPEDVEALVALGDALLGAGREAEAADRFRAALARDPDNVPSLLAIGTLLLASGRPDVARPLFDRVLSISPEQPDALLYRAVARLRLERTLGDSARRDVERFLQVAASTDPRRAMAEGLLSDAVRSSPVTGPSSLSEGPRR